LATPWTAWCLDADRPRRSVRVGLERLGYAIRGARLQAAGEAGIASAGALKLLEDRTATESVHDDVTQEFRVRLAHLLHLVHQPFR